jgi:hypothetical protein
MSDSEPRGKDAVHELRSLLPRLQTDLGQWMGAHWDRVRLEARRIFLRSVLVVVALVCAAVLVVSGVVLVVNGTVELLSEPTGPLPPGGAKLLVGGVLVAVTIAAWLLVSGRADRRVQAAAKLRREQAAENVRRTLHDVETAAGHSLDVAAWTRQYPFASAATAAVLGALAGAKLGSRRRRASRTWDDDHDEEEDDERERPSRRRGRARPSPLLAMAVPLVERFVVDWLRRSARGAAGPGTAAAANGVHHPARDGADGFPGSPGKVANPVSDDAAR